MPAAQVLLHPESRDCRYWAVLKQKVGQHVQCPDILWMPLVDMLLQPVIQTYQILTDILQIGCTAKISFVRQLLFAKKSQEAGTVCNAGCTCTF